MVNPYNNTIEVVEIPQGKDPYDNIEKLQNELECDTIDIVERKIANKWYDIVCDDNGLFKEKNHHCFPSMVIVDEYFNVVQQIVGKAFICNHNKNGELVSLKKGEIKTIMEKAKVTFNTHWKGIYATY